jgi:hypothetical protein
LDEEDKKRFILAIVAVVLFVYFTTGIGGDESEDLDTLDAQLFGG